MVRAFLLVFLLAGSACAGGHFERILSWGFAGTGEAVRDNAEIGVTDLRVTGEKAIAVARACGIRPYCQQAFLPCGKHPQVMSSAERERFDFLMGRDLQGLPKDERDKRLESRRGEYRCRFGGEPEVPVDFCLTDLQCFASDVGQVLSRRRLDEILAANPEAEGIYFDGIGYANLHSCECEDCKSALAAYLSHHALADTEESRNGFYLEALVTYANAMVDYARSRRPGIKVAIHLWPTFRPEPLYGRLIKADYVEETVAWYFPWERAKISEYVRQVCGAKRPQGSQGVPFVGLNATPGQSLAFKGPERLEDELRQILAAGGKSLSVCNGQDMLKPGYREVFVKFAPARSTPVDWESAESVAPGVKAIGFRVDVPRTMECRMLRVDLHQKGLSFASTGRAEAWGEAMPDVTNRTMIIDTRRESTEGFMKRKRAEGCNVVAAINTAPWSPWEPPWNHKFARLPHLAIAGGEVLSHIRKPGPMLVVWNDNTAVITNDLAEADFGRVAIAHPGFSVIMRGGAVPARRPGKDSLAPRTAYGISADGRYLYALIVDGRQPDWSMGADMVDLAEMLKNAGASDAMNMDGGGSTTLVTLGADGKTIVHRNRHEPKYRSYRSVSLNLGIVINPEGR